MQKEDLLEKTKQLKELIKGFETKSFVCYYYYLLNCQIRTNTKPLPLNSPLRQLMYMLSMFMDSSPNASCRFEPMRWDREPIEELLNEIEQGYLDNYFEVLNENGVGLDDSGKYYSVTSQAFTNYFSNGRLSYIEQDVEKIREIFKDHEALIIQKTGLKIADFLDFFDLVENLDTKHFIRFRELTANDEFLDDGRKHYDDDSYFTDERLAEVAEVIEFYMQTIPLGKQELYDYMLEEKVDKLLEIFTCIRKESDNIRFFTDECLLLRKPIIQLTDSTFVVPCAKQLIVAISDFLFELAYQDPNSKRKVLRSRDDFLEKKTSILFRKFLGDGLKVFENFYVDDAEQDLLLLFKDTAFFIECKASKLHAPYRDPVAAFDRIANEFKRSIQKGYDQTERIKKAFASRSELIICDSKRKVIDRINTSRYKNRFSIIVTAERFGPIQTDLGLLLKLPDWDDYPWSVYIDDLEVLLLALKRKKGYRHELISFLNARTKLHERLICADEVELFGYFLMDKHKFLRDCNRFQEVYISSPDMHQLFDELYQTGLGFEFERKMPAKAIMNDTAFRKAMRKRYWLKSLVFDTSGTGPVHTNKF